MSLLSSPNKRSNYPVTLCDRIVRVRSMTGRELRRLEALPKELKTGFVLGLCLVLESGVQEIPQQPEETDVDYAGRVEDALSDAEVDTETIGKISQAIGKIGSVDVESIKKN